MALGGRGRTARPPGAPGGLGGAEPPDRTEPESTVRVSVDRLPELPEPEVRPGRRRPARLPAYGRWLRRGAWRPGGARRHREHLGVAVLARWPVACRLVPGEQEPQRRPLIV